MKDKSRQKERKIERIKERKRRSDFGMKNEISESNEKPGRHIENCSLLFCRYWIKQNVDRRTDNEDRRTFRRHFDRNKNKNQHKLIKEIQQKCQKNITQINIKHK